MNLALINTLTPAALFQITWLNDALVSFFEFVHSGVKVVFANDNISYGLTIIIVTLIVRLALFPLNRKSLQSTTKMTAVQPKLKELQTKYKSNPEKLQQETMKLYKEEGVNPLGGCLPMLLQWPVMIAMYYTFMNLDVSGVKFLGLELMGKAASISNIMASPLLIGTWILPLVSGATTYFSSIIMQPKTGEKSSQTTTMSIGMSIMITFMSFQFNTALVIYWVTNNLFQIAQILFVRRDTGNTQKTLSK
ncbi:membrane protein insertase YidC [Clostridium sp. DL1XJH146]